MGRRSLASARLPRRPSLIAPRLRWPIRRRRHCTPLRIVQQDARTLAIHWADGVESRYDVRALRLACGCAQCVDEWSGEGRLDPAAVPADVHPLRIESVGRYAIQIAWSDGHASGIYPFRRLRELAES
jgi:ATP-binding protein involved in chromosome partitioning